MTHIINRNKDNLIDSLFGELHIFSARQETLASKYLNVFAINSLLASEN